MLAGALALAACDSQTSSAAPKAGAGKAGSTAAGATTDWTQSVVETPEGGYRMGNPDASTRLVEFASFTCPHCRDFHSESNVAIREMVKSGKLSYEYRPFLLNVQDMAAVLMATCEGAPRFFTWMDQLYDNHDAWLAPFMKMTDADFEPLKKLPPEQQLKGLAEAGKMHEFARTRGLPKAKFDQCLTDKSKLDLLTSRQKAATDTYDVQGTPTFILNGKKVDGVANWAGLEPKLRESLK